MKTRTDAVRKEATISSSSSSPWRLERIRQQPFTSQIPGMSISPSSSLCALPRPTPMSCACVATTTLSTDQDAALFLRRTKLSLRLNWEWAYVVCMYMAWKKKEIEIKIYQTERGTAHTFEWCSALHVHAERERGQAPPYAVALRLVNEERNDTVADFRHKQHQQPQQLLLKKKPDKV